MAKCQINVKLLNLTFLLLIYSCFCSCDAQTTKKNVRANIISVKSITSGNTGFRGRAMPEDIGKSNSGVEYLEFELNAKSNCTIDSLNLVFKDTKQSVLLINEALPKLMQKNETWYCHSDNVSAYYQTENGETKEHLGMTIEIYMKGKKESTPCININRILPR